MSDAPRTAEQNVWCLTDQKINDLQVATIDRLIARCGAAHHVDLHVRINGQDEHYEADWLKHLKRVVDPIDQSQLLKFYDVCTKDELIERLYQHIERLQARDVPQVPERIRTHVREG